MLKPLRDWMVVEPIMVDRDVELMIPESAKDSWTAQEAMAFRVLRTGPGWWEDGEFHEMPVKAGDVTILEGKLSVQKIQFMGVDYYIAQGRYVALVKEDGPHVEIGDQGIE